MNSGWPHQEHAERLRQWPIIVHVSARVAEMPELDGLLLLGSFAGGRADEMSDVDFVAVAADGRFREAWERRAELELPGTLFAWDFVPDPDAHGASHKWITRDVVKVECSMVDPATGGMQLAEPYAVIEGDPRIADRFPRIEPISRDVLEAYAQRLRDEGHVPEVEMRYGELRDAIRRAGS